jgi:type II secretory pathway pseudopilin PulG
MRKIKSYEAFTLVEMLIVMGIIIILMAVGIASGRFAIQRANKIEHQNAADQIYQAAQSYYTDNREFPYSATAGAMSPATLLGAGGGLAEYIDEFDGGSDATYTIAIDSTGQEIIVCVSLGGHDDENELGYYCTGNGLAGEIASAPDVKDITYSGGAYSDADIAAFLTANAQNSSDWYASSKAWTE